MQLKQSRVLPLRDGSGSVLRAGTVLIPGPCFWRVRPRLYRNRGPVDIQLRLSTASRWRLDNYAVHTYARRGREG